MKLPLSFTCISDLRNQHHLGIDIRQSKGSNATLKETYFQEVLIWEGRVALKNSGRKFKKHTVHTYGRI